MVASITNLKYLLIFNFWAFPVKSRQRYASYYDVAQMLHRDANFQKSNAGEMQVQLCWRRMSGKSTFLCRLLITFEWRNLGHKGAHFNEFSKQQNSKNLSCFFTRKFFSIYQMFLFNFNLGGRERGAGRGGNSPPPFWFSLNISETVKAVALAFCTIQNHFIRDIRAKFGIYNSPQSSDTEQNSDGYNSRTSDDIDMKLGSVTKLNKRNKTWKKLVRT